MSADLTLEISRTTAQKNPPTLLVFGWAGNDGMEEKIKPTVTGLYTTIYGFGFRVGMEKKMETTIMSYM